ncbi:hypothetical protein Mal15_41040 [Stieleria maiorica]|uniref:Uncharacterized protein n=1 Tax=Stieleria maiorica TaxID=2795974 RepID=A0A5B9MK78_9BACT|nr:hypothetical protein Mal15_41040 [Stieleria maiorica]
MIRIATLSRAWMMQKSTPDLLPKVESESHAAPPGNPLSGEGSYVKVCHSREIRLACRHLASHFSFSSISPPVPPGEGAVWKRLP